MKELFGREYGYVYMQDSLRNTKVEAIKAVRAANFASIVKADLSTCKLCRLQDSLRCT